MEADAVFPIEPPIGSPASCTLVFNSTSMVESKLFVRGNNHKLSLFLFLILVARLASRFSS
jgi:hypothetical protein